MFHDCKNPSHSGVDLVSLSPPEAKVNKTEKRTKATQMRQMDHDILHAQTGEQNHYRLVEDMQRAPEQFEQNLELWEALNRGLHDEPL